MEWQVRYEPITHKQPWSVYAVFEEDRVYKKGFLTEEEAHEWIHKKEKKPASSEDASDPVNKASIDSFPASDPPAWTKITTKQHN